MVSKETLRKVYLEKRLFLSDAEYQARNKKLAEVLFQSIDFTTINTVHIFLSIARQKEVLTTPIIETIKRINPKIKLNISKILPKGMLEHYEYNDQTILKDNNWGVPEPQNGKTTDLSALDLVFIPLISFDRFGQRIGYGKGYYDRFLKKVPQAMKVGLSLSPPLDKILYTNEYDVKMDYCITPFKAYNF